MTVVLTLSLYLQKGVKSKESSYQQKTRLYMASVAWKSEHVLDSNDALVWMLWLPLAIHSRPVSQDLFVYEPHAIRPSKEQQYIAVNEKGLRFTFSLLEVPLELSPWSLSVPFITSSCCYLRYTKHIFI